MIVSPNEINKHLQTVVVAPITSSSKSYPTRIEIKNHKTKGWIVIDQIRTIARERVIKQLGVLHEKEIASIKSIIQETFVD